MDAFSCFRCATLRFLRQALLDGTGRPLARGIALTILLLCSGCLDFEQRMTLTEDGAIEVVFDYTVDQAALPVLRRFQEVLQQWQEGRPVGEVRPSSLAWVFNERLVRSYLKGAGVELVSYHRENLKGRHHVRVVCRASDARRAFRSGVFGDFSLRPTKGGEWTLEAAGDNAPLTGKGAIPDNVRENAAVVRELCRGVRLRLEIIVPGAIIASSADSFSGRRAVWEIDLGRTLLDKTERGLGPIRVTFGGERVRWRE